MIKRIALSKYTIPALVLAMCLCVTNIAFSVGVSVGEEQGAQETAIRYEARQDWLNVFTDEVFTEFAARHDYPYWRLDELIGLYETEVRPNWEVGYISAAE